MHPVAGRLLGLLLASTAIAAPAQTQIPANSPADPAPGSTPAAFADDEIIVTAQRRAERLDRVPVSVTAVSGTNLDRANITGLEALAVQSPAVRIAPAPVSDYIAIRGIGSSLNLGFEQSVATFVDGIYRSRSRSIRSALFDIAQVEILKGPQTTFFGNNAIAGAFNITTRKPGHELAANASALYAPNTSEYLVEAGVDVPLTSTLSARLAGRLAGMNGYMKNSYLGEDSPHLRSGIGRLSLNWQPSPVFETDFRFEYSRQRDQRGFDIQLLNCPPSAPFPGAAGTCARYLAATGGNIDTSLDNQTQANPNYYHLDYYELAQTSSVDLGPASLIFTTGYYRHTYDLMTDVNPVPAHQGGSVVGTDTVTPARFKERYHQFSQEIRLQSEGDTPLSYMAGGYFADDKLDIASFQGFFMAPLGATGAPYYDASDPIVFRILNHQKTRTLSGFGSLSWNPVQPLRLNAGLRYTHVRKTAQRNPSVGTAGSIPGGDNYAAAPRAIQLQMMPLLGIDTGDFAFGRKSESKLMPTASVQYDVADGVMAYASYSRGFKAGGFSGYTSASIFGPETVNAYEVGVKSRLMDGMLTFNLTAFQEDFKGLQQTATVLFPNGSQKAVVGNAASSRSRGIEVAAMARLPAGFRLSTDLTFLDAKFKDYANAPCTTMQAIGVVGCVQDLSGKRPAFAPTFSGNVTAGYTAMDVMGGLGFRLDATVYFTSRFYQQPIADITLSQPGNTKLDVTAALFQPDESLEVSVIGKNLTNKLTASYRQVIPTAVGSVAALQETGRTIAVKLAVKY